MKQSTLRSRWSKEAVESVARALESDGDLSSVPEVLDTDWGLRLRDLRGIPLGAATVPMDWERSIMCDLERIDLSWGDVAGFGAKGAIRSCRFRKATLNGRVGSRVAGCDFAEAVFRADLDGEFSECSFRDAQLRRVSLRRPGVRFVACDFSGAKLRDCDLDHATFEHCRWEGATIKRGSANFTEWVGTRPAESQLQDVYIMTPEEIKQEEQTMRELRIAIPWKSRKKKA